jgi:drug/metabolite transporter (DMT)-like permease
MSAPYGRTVLTGNARRVTGRPVLTASLGAACISSSAILVTLAHVGPITTAFFRCALALPVLVLLAVLEQRRLGPRPPGRRAYAMLAGLFLAIDLVLWNHAISDVGAGVATVLGNLQVLFVGIFAWLVLRERLERRFLIMLPVVLAGVVLVSGMLGGHAAGLHPLAGIGFGVGTSAAYACFLLILRSTSGHTPHVAGPLADVTVGATIGAVVLGLAAGGLQLDIPWPSFGWLLTLALLSQTVGWLLITSALPRLPAAISSLLLLLQPAAAMVLADIVLGERPTLIQVGGALLVCVGVLYVARTPGESGTVQSGTVQSGTVQSGTVRQPRRPEPPVPPFSHEPASHEQDLSGINPARLQVRTENST